MKARPSFEKDVQEIRSSSSTKERSVLVGQQTKCVWGDILVVVVVCVCVCIYIYIYKMCVCVCACVCV